MERFLAHQCDESERETAERWLLDKRVRRKHARHLTSAWSPVPEEVRREIWMRLLPPMTGIQRGTWPLMPAGVIAGWKIAVAALAVGGLTLTLWKLHTRRPTTDGVTPMRIWTTLPAQRASFRLPDGTKVILSVASTLRHPAVFTAASRGVELEGEAYFDVRPDARRPFVVRSRNVVVEDLGTQFGMRAYPDELSPSVVVRAGRVTLRSASASPQAAGQIVMPGQLGRLDAEDNPVVSQADTSMDFAWTHGWLVFDGIPLRTALPQLQRWFDLDFLLADSMLGEMPVTAVLRDQPTAEMLELLAKSLGMEQSRRGRKVTFHRARKESL